MKTQLFLVIALFFGVWSSLFNCSSGSPNPEPQTQEQSTETGSDSGAEDASVTQEKIAEAPVDESSSPDVAIKETPRVEKDEPTPESSQDSDPVPVWRIVLKTAQVTAKVSPYLLGQYDLSGAMFAYDKKVNLINRMKEAGFSEWRVSVGRWEVATWLLPSLTDGSSCATDLAGYPPEAFAPQGQSDFDLVAKRDWFTYTDGKTVTTSMTQNDSRYNLDYIRSVLSVTKAFGVKPFVSIDITPRALALNTKPIRKKTSLYQSACAKTFTNAISNSRPKSTDVYASAVVGMVKRTIEGSNGNVGIPVTHWELGNEPELAEFWDRTYGESKGLSGNELNKEALDSYFGTILPTLLQLDAYRKKSKHPNAQGLKFGVGSFAYASTAETVLKTFDSTTLPNGQFVPFEFVSFHAYGNDPLALVADIKKVIQARNNSTHYKKVEIVLAEWGPKLSGEGWTDTSMDLPLLIATTLVLSAHLGLDRAHHAIFYDFYKPIKFGLLDNSGNPKPLFYAYKLLNQVIGKGNNLIQLEGMDEGKLEQGTGAVLATQDTVGQIQIMVINRNKKAREFDIQGDLSNKKVMKIITFDNPQQEPRTVQPTSTIILPPLSITVVTLSN